ncbi:MAG TPA: exodeoxyribonuclease VII small subunit [Gammaproteobacteria bacterium]|nr:exodeoxyribonuclease VII small subunit [Gammaproteobacteria bacterium]
MSKKELSLARLEKTLEDLEQLVEKLEEGEMPLDQALKEFERGIRLTRQCQAVLKDAEQKIEILLTNAEQPVPFESD